jgi:hypothetical protein
MRSGTVTFGSVPPNRSETRSLPVANGGTARLAASAKIVGAGFSLRAKTLAVPAGASRSFVVVFRPRAAGRYKATLRITSNDPSRPSVWIKLRGTGARP